MTRWVWVIAVVLLLVRQLRCPPWIYLIFIFSALLVVSVLAGGLPATTNLTMRPRQLVEVQTRKLYQPRQQLTLLRLELLRSHRRTQWLVEQTSLMLSPRRFPIYRFCQRSATKCMSSVRFPLPGIGVLLQTAPPNLIEESTSTSHLCTWDWCLRTRLPSTHLPVVINSCTRYYTPLSLPRTPPSITALWCSAARWLRLHNMDSNTHTAHHYFRPPSHTLSHVCMLHSIPRHVLVPVTSDHLSYPRILLHDPPTCISSIPHPPSGSDILPSFVSTYHCYVPPHSLLIYTP